MSDAQPATGDPATLGGGLAVLAGALAVAAVADAPDQLLALAAELAALLAVAVGVWRLRAGDLAFGLPLVTVGGLGVVGALGFGVLGATRATRAIELLPGMVGVALLALGVVPLRARWSRLLVAAGAAALGVGILASGVVLDAGRLRLLAGMALVVVSWDAAEQAINLGEQVGRGNAAPRVVASHGAWSLGVGGLAVLAASGIYAVDVTGLPLLVVALLLAAVLALATAAST